jgi:hypothetical protein
MIEDDGSNNYHLAAVTTPCSNSIPQHQPHYSSARRYQKVDNEKYDDTTGNRMSSLL